MRLNTIFAGAGLAAALLAAPALAETKLDSVLEARSDEDKARDKFRNPGETLTFFGITPDMTVAEAAPGGGWYTRIILPLVAEDGGYMAVNYAPTTFGADNERAVKSLTEWPEKFPAQAAEYVEGTPEIVTWSYGNLPEEAEGKADAFVFMRALHGLARAGDEFLDAALTDVYDVLKPGGMVGVVQHRADEDMSDEWASGANGYLKQSAVIAMFEAKGFEFVDSSEVNANPKDTPSEDEFVWRLPPARRGDESRRAEYDAIGESDRMTLKFVKPAE